MVSITLRIKFKFLSEALFDTHFLSSTSQPYLPCLQRAKRSLCSGSIFAHMPCSAAFKSLLSVTSSQKPSPTTLSQIEPKFLSISLPYLTFLNCTDSYQICYCYLFAYLFSVSSTLKVRSRKTGILLSSQVYFQCIDLCNVKSRCSINICSMKSFPQVSAEDGSRAGLVLDG